MSLSKNTNKVNLFRIKYVITCNMCLNSIFLELIPKNKFKWKIKLKILINLEFAGLNQRRPTTSAATKMEQSQEALIGANTKIP